ncbi:hypothetical protein [Oceanobacter mangrovi]|uniref:hypothetical protein n=1 Tax=Oceanobacter mangrovi TaxID=2862510 RepID=UPI001C8D23C6|nr:hypothetical protein [Oceanobacter mangrovi]
MNISHALTITDSTGTASAAELVRHTTRLELHSPGRAIITAITDTAPQPGQTVIHDAQLTGQPWRPLFFGFIEQAVQINTGAWQIMAREPAALLNRRIALNLRHPLPIDVLNALADTTGLQFVLPTAEQGADWTQTQLARFQHTGGGYGALDNLLRAWAVPGGIWQQQPDGRVFVGNRAYSAQGGKTIELPASIFSDLSNTGGTMPLMPRIRPGAGIKVGDGQAQVIHSIDATGDVMRLQWRPTAAANTLKALQ